MDQTTAQQRELVMAVFQGGALSFDLARETTFAELAEQLGALSQTHGGLLHVRVTSESRAETKALLV